jgi:hypothetical protein
MLFSPLTLAHKRWFMPTDFVLSDPETVTVDFTASNNIFYVDTGMPLAGVSAIAPDGTALPLLRPQEGVRRSSFDIEVMEPGTHRISVAGPPMYFVSYRLPGTTEPQRGRGTLARLKTDLPAQATEVVFAESHSMIETFLTLGTETAPAATADSAGLRMVLKDTHPNALYTDEPARFAFTLDGEPLPGLAVSVQPEGSRYRDEQELREYVTDEAGAVEISWPVAGRYLLEAGLEQDLSEGEIRHRYYNYFLTLEVLAP